MLANALIASGVNAAHVARALSSLHGANPALVTQDNRNALIASGVNTLGVANALGHLHEADPALVTQDNFKVVTVLPLCEAR